MMWSWRGVSGGSDSMAMLRILKELQGKLDFTLRVVHIHHGIRGKEADRDQSFVENICRKWQIPCTVYCYDVPGLSREWKLGEEETGRIVRKEAFQREAAVCGRKDSEIKIALAHNQEDLAETMLHNLCRGTGLRGLCTMRPVDGEIIRPILCLNRDKIAEYLKEKKISHIQDSTNLSDEYTRNRIRHHILPMLEQQVNGKAAAHMAETAARISQAEEYLTQQSCRVLGEFQKGKEYYFTEKFLWSLRSFRFMHYNRRWNSWQADGRIWRLFTMRRFWNFMKCRLEDGSAFLITWKPEEITRE